MDNASLEKIAAGGTPAYVFDCDKLAARIQLLRQHLGSRASLCYAMKANPFLIAPLRETADCFEVCSPGEFRICERAGIPMEKVVLSGVYKAEEDIRRVMAAYPVGVYTAESRRQVALLADCAAACGRTVSVLLRVTSGNQFGMDKADIFDILAHRADYPQLDFIGLQYYSGTQKKRLPVIEAELHMLDELCASIWERLQFVVRRLEYGPGFFVSYFDGEPCPDDGELLDWFAAQLDNMAFGGEISLEFGRYIAADCGAYLTRLVDHKVNSERTYWLADGGIHHLNYYGQSMGMKRPFYRQLPPREEAPPQQAALCGALCTVADVMMKTITLHDPAVGDLLVFENAGAYSVTEGAYLFLSRDLPKIYFFSADGECQLIRDTFPSDTLNFPKEGLKHG